jgi:hypothetical protein
VVEASRGSDGMMPEARVDAACKLSVETAEPHAPSPVINQREGSWDEESDSKTSRLHGLGIGAALEA